MIADDIHNIREGMRKLAQAKVQAEAEAAKRAEADVKPADLPTPKPLFSESAPPFRGFFVTEDGDIVPHGSTPSNDSWSDWIDTQEGNVSAIGAEMLIPAPAIQVSDPPFRIPADMIEKNATLHQTSKSDPGYSRLVVQAANGSSNRYTFWGYRGEDPEGQ